MNKIATNAMNEKTEIYSDLKSSLPAGPWRDEPDRVEFKHEGFTCLLNRSQFGAWCGYVAMPAEHPWYGKGYSSVSADVHGGLTYAGKCQGEICHVPAPGESDDIWWLGFDCAHSGDGVPGSRAMRSAIRMNPISFLDPNRDDAGAEDDPYRDMAYVRAETEKLASQAAAVRP